MPNYDSPKRFSEPTSAKETTGVRRPVKARIPLPEEFGLKAPAAKKKNTSRVSSSDPRKKVTEAGRPIRARIPLPEELGLKWPAVKEKTTALESLALETREPPKRIDIRQRLREQQQKMQEAAYAALDVRYGISKMAQLDKVVLGIYATHEQDPLKFEDLVDRYTAFMEGTRTSADPVTKAQEKGTNEVMRAVYGGRTCFEKSASGQTRLRVFRDSSGRLVSAPETIQKFDEQYRANQSETLEVLASDGFQHDMRSAIVKECGLSSPDEIPLKNAVYDENGQILRIEVLHHVDIPPDGLIARGRFASVSALQFGTDAFPLTVGRMSKLESENADGQKTTYYDAVSLQEAVPVTDEKYKPRHLHEDEIRALYLEEPDRVEDLLGKTEKEQGMIEQVELEGEREPYASLSEIAFMDDAVLQSRDRYWNGVMYNPVTKRLHAIDSDLCQGIAQGMKVMAKPILGKHTYLDNRIFGTKSGPLEVMMAKKLDIRKINPSFYAKICRMYETLKDRKSIEAVNRTRELKLLHKADGIVEKKYALMLERIQDWVDNGGPTKLDASKDLILAEPGYFGEATGPKKAGDDFDTSYQEAAEQEEEAVELGEEVDVEGIDDAIEIEVGDVEDVGHKTKRKTSGNKTAKGKSSGIISRVAAFSKKFIGGFFGKK